jgi:hypothetical protein
VRWLIPLLEVIGDIEPGALRVKNKHLIIATKNTRHVDVLKAFELLPVTIWLCSWGLIQRKYW